MKHWSEVAKVRQEWVASNLYAVVEALDRLIAEAERLNLPARQKQLEDDREALIAALEYLGYWVREVKP
jgi:hypothetical protein